MKPHSLLAPFATALLIFSAHAESSAVKKNVAIILGGGCESGNLDNQFIEDIRESAKGLKDSGWDVRVLFDGSNGSVAPFKSANKTVLAPECSKVPSPEACPYFINPNGWSRKGIALAAKITSSKIKEASKQSFFKQLDQQIATLKRGSQLLIDIQTHGSSLALGDSHRVCLNGSNENLSTSDPEFIARLRLLKEKGVKLGFIDDSCFSGASVPTLEQFGCVISATTADSVAGSGDLSVNNTMSRLLAVGPNGIHGVSNRGLVPLKALTLETVYLVQLAQTGAMFQPQISGENDGEETTRWLMSLGGLENGGALEALPVNYCSKEQMFEDIERLGKQIQHVTSQGHLEAIGKLWAEYDGSLVDGNFSDLATKAQKDFANYKAFENKFLSEAEEETRLVRQLIGLLSQEERKDYHSIESILLGTKEASTPEKRLLQKKLTALRTYLSAAAKDNLPQFVSMQVHMNMVRFGAMLQKRIQKTESPCSTFLLKNL